MATKIITVEGQEYIEVDEKKVGALYNELVVFLNEKDYTALEFACALITLLDSIQEDTGLDPDMIRKVPIDNLAGGNA